VRLRGCRAAAAAPGGAFHEGERNATQLFGEFQLLGYPGGELAVERYLCQFRHDRGHAARPATTPRLPRSGRTPPEW